jgi:uncharacterized SAM-dependent methyltransferase
MGTLDSDDSSILSQGSYELHPEIMTSMKVDKGSLDMFVKMDDIDRMLNLSDKYCDNYILAKIDKTGLVGKEARAEIRKRQIVKER